ncbi:MAG: DUF4349 domain-containing protein [Acidobacteria bacterium]|nr:DUF4349 domain-containing protein [Acidobacteriota bacterium]
MRQITTLLVITMMFVTGGCRKTTTANLASYDANITSRSAPPPASAARVSESAQGTIGKLAADEEQVKRAFLDSANPAESSTRFTERKIIRNAEMTIETGSPNDDQRKIAAIAEKNGGFVVTSESSENQGRAQSSPSTTVTVVARVPASKFGEAVDEIHRIGGRILREKIAGQDVTEEFIDIEARIRTKRALEAQFLEIMKQARKVSDALEVQTQLAEVRTEIERFEGRRRFIENQSSLSTITVTLLTPTPIVVATTSGFSYGVKSAFGDGLDTAAEILLGIIRFVIVMIPVIVFILLPGWLLFRWLRRYVSWPKKPAPAMGITDQTE